MVKKLNFTKMHGNGNDFVVFESDRGLTTSDLSQIARKVCERKTSVGADGILVIEIGYSNVDFHMRIFNADGSEGEMCGNGARCAAKFAFDKKICGAQLAFSTLAGVMRAEISDSAVALDMGEIDVSGVKEEPACFCGTDVRYAFLTVGVPHCVVFADSFDLNDKDRLFTLGKAIRNDFSRFPNGTNVNFVKQIGGEIWAITYERGVEDLTDSCGTGSVAAAIVMNKLRNEPAPLRIKNKGGVNEVDIRKVSETRVGIILKGAAVSAFTGEVAL